MKTSWLILRQAIVTKDTNSCGGMAQLIIAGESFIRLLPNLKDEDEALKDFNSDGQYTTAILNRRKLVEMNLLPR